MPAPKKKNPRVAIVIFRTTRAEKRYLEELAMRKGLEFSQYLRLQLGLPAKNE